MHTYYYTFDVGQKDQGNDLIALETVGPCYDTFEVGLRNSVFPLFDSIVIRMMNACTMCMPCVYHAYVYTNERKIIDGKFSMEISILWFPEPGDFYLYVYIVVDLVVTVVWTQRLVQAKPSGLIFFKISQNLHFR